MILPILAAAAALPPPLAPSDREDLRCVATLAVVAHEQVNGLWGQVAPLADDGARYAARIGDGLVERGIAREAVSALLLGEAKTLQKAGPLKRVAVERCVARLRAALPPLSLPRCAALMKRAADAALAREPESENTRQLTALAPVVIYRAEQDGMTAEAFLTERTRVAAEPTIDGGELNDCARFAVAPKP